MSSNIDKFTATHDVSIWWENDATRHLITRRDPGDPMHLWQRDGIGFEIVTDSNGNLPPIATNKLGASSNEIKWHSDYRAILRSDRHEMLGVVSKNYNLHSVAQICDAAKRVEDESGYQMKTCGSLSRGKRIFFMLETDKDVSIAGEKMNRNVLIGTSFDGKSSSFSICTDVMVVCENTLSAALDTGANMFRLSHKSAFSKDHLIGSLQALGEQQQRNREIIERLVAMPADDETLRDYFGNVTELLPVPTKVKTSKDDSVKKEWRNDQVADLFDSYRHAPGGTNNRNRVESRVGTMHGATQAVYHFVDHKLLKTQANQYKANYNLRRLGLPGFQSESKIKNDALHIALQEVE